MSKNPGRRRRNFHEGASSNTQLQRMLTRRLSEVQASIPGVVLVKDGKVTEEGKRRGITLDNQQ